MWVQSLCLLVYLQLIGIHTQSFTKEAYPDPLNKPGQCGRGEKSFICDPGKLITEKHADEIHNEVRQLQNLNPCPCSECESGTVPNAFLTIAIALVPSIEGVPEDADEEARQNATKNFADYLRTKWNYRSSKECENDAVLVLAKQQKQKSLAIGGKVTKKIAKACVERFLGNIDATNPSTYAQDIKQFLLDFTAAVQNDEICVDGLTKGQLQAIIASVSAVVAGSFIIAIVILVKSRSLRQLSDSDPMMVKIKAAKEKKKMKKEAKKEAKKQKGDSQQQKLVEGGAAGHKDDTVLTEVQDISQPVPDSSSSIQVPTQPESESHTLKSKPSLDMPPSPKQPQQWVTQDIPRTTDSQHDATAVQQFEPEEDNDEEPGPNIPDEDNKSKQDENFV